MGNTDSSEDKKERSSICVTYLYGLGKLGFEGNENFDLSEGDEGAILHNRIDNLNITIPYDKITFIGYVDYTIEDDIYKVKELHRLPVSECKRYLNISNTVISGIISYRTGEGEDDIESIFYNFESNKDNKELYNEISAGIRSHIEGFDEDIVL